MSFPYTSHFDDAMVATASAKGLLFAQVPSPSTPAPAPVPSPSPSPSPAPSPAPAPDMASFDNAAWASYLAPLQAYPQPEFLMPESQGALDADVFHEGLEPQVLGDVFVPDPQLQHDEVPPANEEPSPNEGNNLEMDADMDIDGLGVDYDLFGDPIAGDQPSDDTAPSEETTSCADTSSSSETEAQAQDKPAPQTASELTGMRLPCVPVQYAPAPQTASELTGMRLPCVPLQYAEGNEPTPSAGAAEALDTPVQMPAPENVDEPLPDAEDVPAIAPVPAVAPVPVVMSPPPMAPEVDEASILASLNDPAFEANALANADAQVAQLNARNNGPVPSAANVPIPQNNMWNGQGMQPQMNGMFRPSPAGNIPMPQGYFTGMAGQEGMRQMAMHAQMQGHYASGFNPSLPSNMPTYGMHPLAPNFAQPGVQAGNPLNPHWGMQNGHLPAQSHPQLNGYIHQARQPVMLNAPAQHQVPQFFGQVQPAPFVNGTWNTNAQLPALNAPRQMAPANQMVNGMGQHQSFQSHGQGAPAPVLNQARNPSAPLMNGRVQYPTVDSPEVYRSFWQRPNSKPGHQLLAFCIGCKVQMKQFGVRCENCKLMHGLALNLENRSCIACKETLEPGTDRIFCDEHHKGKYQYTNREKDTFRRDGICTECRKVDADKGVTCKNCRESKNEVYQARIEEATSQGICPTCGEPNPSGCKKCDACRERDNAKRRKRPSPEKEDGTGGKRPRKA